MCKELNIEELKEILNGIRNITASNLYELISELCSIYSNNEVSNHQVYSSLIKKLFNTDEISIPTIKHYFAKIYLKMKAKEMMEKLLKVLMKFSTYLLMNTLNGIIILIKMIPVK